MKTDVFPVEDSVPVVWSRARLDWQIKSRSKRADQARFRASVHGPACRECDDLDGRVELPLISRRRDYTYGWVYRLGLFGLPNPYVKMADSPECAAYDLGRDEAQLIDWQK